MEGDKPTKEVPLHSAFYETRGAKAGAVAHLHAIHSMALLMLPDNDPGCLLPPLRERLQPLSGLRAPA